MCSRPRRCSLARVQPALKDAVCKGAHIAALACPLHQTQPPLNCRLSHHITSISTNIGLIRCLAVTRQARCKSVGIYTHLQLQPMQQEAQRSLPPLSKTEALGSGELGATGMDSLECCQKQRQGQVEQHGQPTLRKSGQAVATYL